MNKITIAICTYNRGGIIHKCIQSIYNQNISNIFFELLIVNNNSSDNTEQVVLEFADKFPNYKYVIEVEPGLSNARNRAINDASFDWIAYFDDDVVLKPDYIGRALKIIESHKFDCFGGKYIPLYLKPKPKWIPSSYHKNSNADSIKSITQLFDDNVIAGNNMVFNKAKLIELGGFDKNLGMIENEVKYGEDNLIQKRFLANNYTLGFDPLLLVEHIVMPHKLKLTWQLHSIYSHSRDRAKIEKTSISKTQFFKILIKSILQIPEKSIKIFSTNYYWQNVVIEILRPILHAYAKTGAKR